MTDRPEDLTLAFLRRLDAKVDRLADDIRDMKARQIATDLAVAGIRQDAAKDAEARAHIQAGLDARLERIERRLELRDA